MRFIRNLKRIIREQLTQGVEPGRLAFGVSLAFSIGIFPLLGFSTMACLAVGGYFRLNQPLLQAVNYVVAPLQLVMMPVFLRAGEFVFSQKPPIPFSPFKMIEDFFNEPAVFLAVYGKAGMLAVGAWGLLTPLAALAVFYLCRSSFVKLANSLRGNVT